MAWIIIGIVCVMLGCLMIFSDDKKNNFDFAGIVVIFLSTIILSVGLINLKSKIINKNKSSEKDKYIEKVITLDNSKDTISITYIYKKDNI